MYRDTIYALVHKDRYARIGFQVLTGSKELMLQKGYSMTPIEKFNKARKCYSDFPFLWAIEPRCTYASRIRIMPLDGELVSSVAAEGVRWWMHLKWLHSEEIHEVPPVGGIPLANKIVQYIGIGLVSVTILHLISAKDTTGLSRDIIIHKPRKEGFGMTPILNVCMNRIH